MSELWVQGRDRLAGEDKGRAKAFREENMKLGKYAARNSSCWTGWFRQVCVGPKWGKA